MTEIDLKTLASILQWVLMGGIALYSHLIARAAANAADVAALQVRMSQLEEQVRHLPGHALVAELAGDLKALKAEMAAMRTSLGPMVTSLDRVHDYLLHAKGGQA